MKLFPWILAALLLIAAGYFYTANSKKARELITLRSANQELESVRAALEEASSKGEQVASEELVQLRKENEDLLRLRNEVRQLREQRQQLSSEAQQAKASAQAAQTQVLTAQSQLQVIQSQNQNQQAGQGATAQPGGAIVALSPDDVTGACINNLRQLDGAVQQWALENRKPAETAVTATDITPYLRGNTLPACPAGGAYGLKTVAETPTCTYAGHALSK